MCGPKHSCFEITGWCVNYLFSSFFQVPSRTVDSFYSGYLNTDKTKHSNHVMFNFFFLYCIKVAGQIRESMSKHLQCWKADLGLF